MSKKRVDSRVPRGSKKPRSAAGQPAHADAPAPSPAPSESPEAWFHRRATYYVEAQVLFHLNQVGIFSALESGGSFTAAQLAAGLDLDEHLVDVLLDYVFEVDQVLSRDASGRYALSAFGKQVVQRFSSSEPQLPARINFFDVRVGGYGPVWANLGRMLQGTARYGQDFQRDGRYAEAGVRKLSTRFWPALQHELTTLPIGQVLEIGLTTGLLERVGVEQPRLGLYGVDRSSAALAQARARAVGMGVERIQWLQGSLFDLETWSLPIHTDPPGLIFSLHFHEFLAAGEAQVVAWLRELRHRFPGWYVLALEQPRLPHADRESLPDHQWLYAQSNVLIHHLIGNGRILSREQWIDLGQRAGCKLVRDRACDYLGYRAFVFQLGQREQHDQG